MTETNFEQVAAVPFFVKAPGQTQGRVDDDIVRNVDIVPTVADAARHEGLVEARRPLGRSPRRRTHATRSRCRGATSAA